MTDATVLLGTVTVNSSAAFPAYNFSTNAYVTVAFTDAAGSGFTPSDPTASTPPDVVGATIGLIGVVGVGGGSNPNNFVVALEGDLPQDYFDTVTFPLGGTTTLNSADAIFNGPDTSVDGWSVWLFADQSGNGYSPSPDDVIVFSNVVDMTAEFNCDCELVSSLRTLAQLRLSMAIQCGYAATAANLPAGQIVEFNEYLRTAQVQLYLKFRAQRTERFFRWTMVPGLRYYGLDAAEGACTLQLNPLAISWVGFEDLNKAWYRLVEGIDPVYYTRANINFGWPTRYEIRSCIEIFPAPQAAYTLWIKGDIGLAPFAVDADHATFDDEAVLLFAVANWKSAKGKPDWERAMNQATARIQDLTARKHGTYRYVPSTYVQNPATPPRFLPLGSQQA